MIQTHARQEELLAAPVLGCCCLPSPVPTAPQFFSRAVHPALHLYLQAQGHILIPLPLWQHPINKDVPQRLQPLPQPWHLLHEGLSFGGDAPAEPTLLGMYYFVRSTKFPNCSMEMLLDSPPISAGPPPPRPLLSSLCCIHSV